MKKSLIALAVLAASGAAMAQSSVQVYGIVDVWVGSLKNNGTFDPDGVKPLGTSGTRLLNDGGLSPSRIGFMGSEDLGGGLKVNFQLESGFNADNGTGFNNFGRQSWVGLSGSFGEVRIGNAYSAFDDVSAAAFANFDSAFAPEYGVFASTEFEANPKNQLRYTSPEFSGFTFSFSTSLDEKNNASEGINAFALAYEQGPLTAVLGYQTEGKDLHGGEQAKFTRLAGAYDFGVVVAKLNYGRVVNGQDRTREYSVGVDFPVSSALTLSGAYATSRDRSAGVSAEKRNGFGISATYSLSNRTTAYAGLTNLRERDATGRIGEQRLYAVGLKHSF